MHLVPQPQGSRSAATLGYVTAAPLGNAVKDFFGLKGRNNPAISPRRGLLTWASFPGALPLAIIFRPLGASDDLCRYQCLRCTWSSKTVAPKIAEGIKNFSGGAR